MSLISEMKHDTKYIFFYPNNNSYNFKKDSDYLLY